jgi:exonuclease SbcC
MPDMSSLRSTLEKAKARLEETLREEGQKNQEMGQKMKLSSALKQKNEELEEQDKRYKIVGGLAKIAKGDNNIRISFHRYVLKALLENVLTFASKRLQMISKGKYYLHSVTDSTDRRRALELEVNDADTGQSRSVDTLSGGESFYTSLSLALGLADIAGGGRHLDSIFIDEGFGSLDSDTLDTALNTLDTLRSEGRLIGIISHVESLKERFPVRLQVSPGKNGSKAEFVVG